MSSGVRNDDIVPARMTTTTDAQTSCKEPLNQNQIRGFWASWGGWALDGMDSFIYALVLVPSLRDLLPRSGISATEGNVGFYGGLLFALFLVGWGLAFLWGPIADKFGRVRTLMITIAWYSVFTFLSALVTNVWQLAALRLLAGIGIGGEWAMGGTFVADEWPESRREAGAGYMHTGYYVGIFLAAIVSYLIGNRWRAMFVVGGMPALLLAWVRHGVTEPSRWVKKKSVVRSWAVWQPFAALFTRAWRSRTILNTLFMLVSICGFWAGTVYVPAAVTTLAEAAGRATGFSRHHAGFVCLDSWLLGHAVVCRAPGTAGRAGRLFWPDADFHRAHFRKAVLCRLQRASLVFCVFVFPGIWRGEFRGVYTVAAGAVSHRMPRQRVCVRHVVCTFRRCGNHVFGRRRRAVLRLAWRARGADFFGIRGGSAADSFWGGNARTAAAGVTRRNHGRNRRRG